MSNTIIDLKNGKTLQVKYFSSTHESIIFTIHTEFLSLVILKKNWQTSSSTEEGTVAFAGGKKEEATAGENSPSQSEGPPQKKKARKQHVVQVVKFLFGSDIQTHRIAIPATINAVMNAATKQFPKFQCKSFCISWKIVYKDEDG